MRQSNLHHVTVALRMAGIAGQDKLNGIFEYLRADNRWHLSIFRTAQEFTADVVRREIERGAEGFIIGIPDAIDALDAIACSDVPTVVMNVSHAELDKRTRNIAFVRSDSDAIGKGAARELLKQGIYRSFGYVGYRVNEAWSRDRGNAFRDELENSGHVGRMFDLTHYPDMVDDRETMLRWLRDLPKPCGILASCDDCAFEILDACREAGIRVPAEIGIFGVNNDPILCENAEPPLSSVQPDFIREGYLAADILGRMLTRRNAPQDMSPSVHLVGIRQIVHRSSTLPPSDSGLLVQRAIAYIQKNATRGIGVQDVARHLKVSYSLLNLRFHELQHESIYETILQTRLETVRRLLLDPGTTVASIAEQSGWPSPEALRKFFKQRYGKSMRRGDWVPDHRRHRTEMISQPR